MRAKGERERRSSESRRGGVLAGPVSCHARAGVYWRGDHDASRALSCMFWRGIVSSMSSTSW
jgi:hypothetical protein